MVLYWRLNLVPPWQRQAVSVDFGTKVNANGLGVNPCALGCAAATSHHLQEWRAGRWSAHRRVLPCPIQTVGK